MAMPMKNSINLRYSSFSMARGQNSARLFVCFYSRAKYKYAINVPMEFPHYRGVVVASCQKMQMPSVYCICFALALACVSNKPNSNSCSVFFLFCFVLPCQSYCDGRKMRWFVACFFGWRFATIVCYVWSLCEAIRNVCVSEKKTNWVRAPTPNMSEFFKVNTVFAIVFRSFVFGSALSLPGFFSSVFAFVSNYFLWNFFDTTSSVTKSFDTQSNGSDGNSNKLPLYVI